MCVGVFYLYMKTIERAHKPNELWERVKLPRNYEKALEIIDKHLMYWPKLLVHKIKQEKIMTTPRKQMKREARREEKAEKAAVLDKSIEKELLERLKSGVYGDIYNYPVNEYNKILDMEELHANAEDEEEEEPEVEYVEGYDELEEEEDIEDFGNFPLGQAIKANDDMLDDDEETYAVDAKDLKRSGPKLEKDEARKLKRRQRPYDIYAIHSLHQVEHEDAPGRQKATS
ncbi:hypothetical protein K2173_028598 [Erythroxylum novogranatense]|uniref:Ribosomal eL28/Mak16 domain-containing protein n=1 Tax=Erythroxylum novogranatense TaxID=1862640 RepID=A0AAV8U2C5_9ROSI|nr:hypothetical protein K2173_028598 [Erythroxylum novogranatense]